MTPTSPLIPLAPEVYDKDLPIWRLLRNAVQSSLSIWPDYAFDTMFSRRNTLGIKTVLVNDPDGIKHVLGTNRANYRRPIPLVRVAKPLGGNGLFLAEGEDWKRQRKLLSSTFTPAHINVLVPHFQNAGEQLMQSIGDTNEANLSQAFQQTALETVLRALFSLPDNPVRQQLSAMVRAYVAGPGRPSLFDAFAKKQNDFSFSLKPRNQFQSEWFRQIDAIIDQRATTNSSTAPRDLLDLLLSLKDAETGNRLSTPEIRDQCATMLFAGSETTARLMFWATYLLTLDQGEQESIRAELQAFPIERVANLDDLKNWPRLRNVLFETLRLYPPLPHIIRDAQSADEICGENISPGTQVWISPWVLHRHRKFWKNPTAFIPNRFEGVGAPWVQMPGFIPFGSGPRICIGLHFALAEAQIILAHLLLRFTIGTSGDPVLPIGRISTEPSHEPTFHLKRI